LTPPHETPLCQMSRLAVGMLATGKPELIGATGGMD
jgi:hypothetical protein